MFPRCGIAPPRNTSKTFSSPVRVVFPRVTPGWAKAWKIHDPGNTFLSKKHKTGEQRQDWRSNSPKALNLWSLGIDVQRVWGLHIDAENRAILLSAISSVMGIRQEAKPDDESSNPRARIISALSSTKNPSSPFRQKRIRP